MQHTEQPKRGSEKPSLLASAVPHSSDTDNDRILSSLSGASPGRSAKPKAPGQPTRRTGLWLLVLLLGAAALAWGVFNRPAAPVDTTPSPATMVVPPSAPTTVASADTVTAPAIAAAASQTAATIVTDEPQPTATQAEATASADGHANLTSTLEAGVKVPANTLKAALKASPAAAPPVKATTASTSRPATVAAKARPPAAKPVAVADNDVDLISALVAHTENQPIPESTAPPQSRKAASARVNQDIVERQHGDSTVSLLKRCKRLGGTEAKLCHRRICSGASSNDAACKAK
ncbi:MAG: hypothetical protein ABIP34_07125 [Rhodoferax sp.]|uniref:hypothetical protein n=1 Tax=Rhodoferax sp. TaxID=50421 RepID=UPI0032667D5D